MSTAHFEIDPGFSKIDFLAGASAVSFEPVDSSRNVFDESLQGQKFNAVIVMVVSRQFENVLVEQNHCQGLNIVIRSCVSISEAALNGRRPTLQMPN